MSAAQRGGTVRDVATGPTPTKPASEIARLMGDDLKKAASDRRVQVIVGVGLAAFGVGLWLGLRARGPQTWVPPVNRKRQPCPDCQERHAIIRQEIDARNAPRSAGAVPPPMAPPAASAPVWDPAIVTPTATFSPSSQPNGLDIPTEPIPDGQ